MNQLPFQHVISMRGYGWLRFSSVRHTCHTVNDLSWVTLLFNKSHRCHTGTRSPTSLMSFREAGPCAGICFSLLPWLGSNQQPPA